MWICQVRAATTRKTFKSCCPSDNPGSFPSSSHLLYTSCWDQILTVQELCSWLLSPGKPWPRYPCNPEGMWRECKGASKGYPLHSPPTRQNTVTCAFRQKTWTVPSRSSCEVRQISAMAQSSWLPSCFRKWWVWEAISKKGPFPRLHQELENQTKKRIVCSLPKPAALAFHAPCLWICSGVSPGWKEIEASMTNAALILPLLPLAPFQRGIKLIPCWFVTLAL